MSTIDFIRARFSAKGAFGLQLTIGLLVMMLGFGIFSEIAEDLQTQSQIARDHFVTAWFHNHATPGCTAAARFMTTFGSVAFLATASVLVSALFAFRKSWDRLLVFCSAVLGGSVLNIVLKHFYHRQRPVLENPFVTLSSYGFPSGHTMGSTIFYGVLVLIVWSTNWARWAKVAATFFAFALVLTIGLTRIYLGAHYLTDVLAAFAAGAVWLALCWSALESSRKYRHRRETRLKLES